MSNLKSWRPANPHAAKRVRMGCGVDFPATRFMDNVVCIGNSYVCCFLIETSEGYVILDNMTNDCAEYIESQMISIGLDPAKLKYILITHGHGDHFGNAGYFRKKYGTKILMSAIDEAFGRDPKNLPPGAPASEALGFEIDGHLADGDRFVLGDTWIDVVMTPGHTPGCLSYIFPVWDEGRPHVASLWGGTGPARERELQEKHLESAIRFTQITIEKGVDVAVSTHPFVDNTVQKLEMCRNLFDGVPNPFVMTQGEYFRFQQMYIDNYRDVLSK